jgi:hypothetical protein
VKDYILHNLSLACWFGPRRTIPKLRTSPIQIRSGSGTSAAEADLFDSLTAGLKACSTPQPSEITLRSGFSRGLWPRIPKYDQVVSCLTAAAPATRGAP